MNSFLDREAFQKIITAILSDDQLSSRQRYHFTSVQREKLKSQLFDKLEEYLTLSKKVADGVKPGNESEYYSLMENKVGNSAFFNFLFTKDISAWRDQKISLGQYSDPHTTYDTRDLGDKYARLNEEKYYGYVEQRGALLEEIAKGKRSRNISIVFSGAITIGLALLSIKLLMLFPVLVYVVWFCDHRRSIATDRLSELNTSKNSPLINFSTHLSQSIEAFCAEIDNSPYQGPTGDSQQPSAGAADPSQTLTPATSLLPDSNLSAGEPAPAAGQFSSGVTASVINGQSAFFSHPTILKSPEGLDSAATTPTSHETLKAEG